MGNFVILKWHIKKYAEVVFSPFFFQAIFDRFDRDRSGEIDSMELRDALLSLGYAVPPSVIQVLISNYTDGKTGRGALNFDNFVEWVFVFWFDVIVQSCIEWLLIWFMDLLNMQVWDDCEGKKMKLYFSEISVSVKC